MIPPFLVADVQYLKFFASYTTFDVNFYLQPAFFLKRILRGQKRASKDWDLSYRERTNVAEAQAVTFAPSNFNEFSQNLYG